MHRNTYLLVSVLAAIAALIMGVHIGRSSMRSEERAHVPSPTPLAAAVSAAPKPYRNDFCRVTFEYPEGMSILENASGSAVFTGPGANDRMILICQRDIPKPASLGEDSESIRIGSVAATLYRSAPSAQEGAALDTLIVRHPGTRLDVFLAGTSAVIRSILPTFRLIP